jgi:hypothetical protein
MAGYLDHYGEGEERREKIFKYAVLTLAAVLILGGGLSFWFWNYPQERQANRFFELLAAKDYNGAYALWGCTDANPCPDYPLARFMEDWGPGPRDPKTFRVLRSRSCGSGVILTVDTGVPEQEKLWIQREDLTMGFSPYPGCPPGR